ncbi:MAG TPA: ABC transporter substrate-binding protein [Firmicutes bacterium]|nr:ABC transporter substrate-binding protein [Bacillota bacterium]
MRRKALWLLVALVGTALVAGCSGGSGGGGSADQDKLYVAVAGALTGPCAQDGEAIKNGATLAAEHINAKGGVKGKKIELVFEDDRSDPKEAANVANKLVNDKKILAVIGHYNSSCTLAGAPIYNKAGLVEISCGSTSPAVSNAGPYTFRVIVTDAFQGDVASKWMIDEGYKRIAILYENDDYGAGLKDVVSTKVKEYGGEIVGVESYYLGETKDFSPYITKLRGANPDALFIAGLYNEAALIAKQSHAVGWKPPIFGVDGPYNPAYITLGGEATEGTRLIGFFHPDLPDPMVQQFVADFQKKYNKSMGTYEAYGYDAMLILAEAMERGGTDRESIKNYLTTLKGFKGVTGVTSFDENGDCIKVPLKLIVKDGKFQLYQK